MGRRRRERNLDAEELPAHYSHKLQNLKSCLKFGEKGSTSLLSIQRASQKSKLEKRNAESFHENSGEEYCKSDCKLAG